MQFLNLIRRLWYNLSTECSRDTLPLNDNFIAQFFSIQSELSDEQGERLISTMSLRNIKLENCTYDMLQTQCHDLLNTTRTLIQHPTLRPTRRFTTELEQGEYEGQQGFWVGDEDEHEGVRAKLRSGSRKGKTKGRKGNRQRCGFKPFQGSVADTRHAWEKAKERREIPASESMPVGIIKIGIRHGVGVKVRFSAQDIWQ